MHTMQKMEDRDSLSIPKCEMGTIERMIIYHGFMVVCERCGSDDLVLYEIADKNDAGLPLQLTMKQYVHSRTGVIQIRARLEDQWRVQCKTCEYMIHFTT